MVSFLVCFCFILYPHDFMQYIYFMKSKFFFKPEHVAAFASACISFVRFILPCNQDICSQSLRFCVASFTCSDLYFDFMPFRECRRPFKRSYDGGLVLVHRASITYETNAAVMLSRLQLLCFCLLWTAVKGCLTLTIAVFAFAPVFGIKRVRRENSFSFARAACSWAALSETSSNTTENHRRH